MRPAPSRFFVVFSAPCPVDHVCHTLRYSACRSGRIRPTKPPPIYLLFFCFSRITSCFRYPVEFGFPVCNDIKSIYGVSVPLRISRSVPGRSDQPPFPFRLSLAAVAAACLVKHLSSRATHLPVVPSYRQRRANRWLDRSAQHSLGTSSTKDVDRTSHHFISLPAVGEALDCQSPAKGSRSPFCILSNLKSRIITWSSIEPHSRWHSISQTRTLVDTDRFTGKYLSSPLLVLQAVSPLE